MDSISPNFEDLAMNSLQIMFLTQFFSHVFLINFFWCFFFYFLLFGDRGLIFKDYEFKSFGVYLLNNL